MPVKCCNRQTHPELFVEEKNQGNKEEKNALLWLQTIAHTHIHTQFCI